MQLERLERKRLFALMLGIFFPTLAIGVFTFAFPLLALQNKIPGGWLGLLFSGYFLAKCVLSPVAGNWADRYSPRPLLLGALIFGAVLPCSYFFNATHASLSCIQFGLGLCAGVIKPVGLAAIAGLTPSSRHGAVFGWCNAMTNVAFFLGPTLGGLLFYSMRMERVLAFLVGAMLVSSALVAFFLPSDLKSAQQSRQGKDQKEERIGMPVLFAAVLGRTLGVSATVVFFPILLAEQLGSNKILIGLIAAVPPLATCLLLPWGGILADRTRRDLLMLGGMTLSALALALLGQMHTLPLLIMTGTVLGMGAALSFPAAFALASAMRSDQGKTIGLLQSASSLGFIIGPLVCGLTIQFCASVRPAFAVLGALGVLACFPLAWSLGGHRVWRPAAVLTLSVLCITACFSFRSLPSGPSEPSGSRSAEVSDQENLR